MVSYQFALRHPLKSFANTQDSFMPGMIAAPIRARITNKLRDGEALLEVVL